MESRSETPALLSRLTTLGDLARLRMLRLLDAHELSVGELARALQLPQSTVSRHLKLLHDGDWIVRRNEGTATFFRLDPKAVSTNAAEADTLAKETKCDGWLLDTLTKDGRNLFGQARREKALAPDPLEAGDEMLRVLVAPPVRHEVAPQGLRRGPITIPVIPASAGNRPTT